MRLTRRWLVALMTLALVAAACGGGDGDEGESPQPTGDGEPTATETVGGELEEAAVWTGPEQENFERVISAFEEQSGASVTFTSSGDDIGAFLGPRIEGGEPPDIAILPQPGLLADLAEQGALQPIEEFAGEGLDENFAPVWRELGTVDGELYGLWWKAANKSTVWYNTGVFEQAGVEPPEDWEGLKEAAGTIQAFGVTPFSIGGADGWTLTDWFENIYLRTAGPEMYDQLSNHEIPWTDQSVKDALATFAEIVGNEEWVVGGASGALQTDFNTSATNIIGDPPKAAIVYEGDFVQGVITGSTEAEAGTDFNFFPFPSINDSPPSVLGGGDAAVLMTDNPAAQEFINFLTTPEAAAEWIPQGGFTSPNQNVDLGLYPDDISRASAEALVASEAVRFDMSDLQPAEFGATAGQGLWGILQEFLRTPDDVDGIAQRLEDAATEAFGS